MQTTKTTIAGLRAIRDRVFAREPQGAEEERRRAQTQVGPPVIISLAEAHREGFVNQAPATDADIDQVFAQRGEVVRGIRATFDAHESAVAAIEREALGAIEEAALAELRNAHAEATALEARLTDAEKRLARHSRSAPASGATIERWAAELSALETTVLVLDRQAAAARELADGRRLSVEMELARTLKQALSELDQALPAVEARYAAALELARSEKRAHHARRDALASVLVAVERGELAALEH